jgi:hypothetical protein
LHVERERADRLDQYNMWVLFYYNVYRMSLYYFEL